MKYIALRDSLDHKRLPAYCIRGTTYEFSSDPGKHFESLEPTVAIVIERPKDEKAALLQEAEELGLEVDKRWSLSRLKAEIDKAKESEDGEQ